MMSNCWFVCANQHAGNGKEQPGGIGCRNTQMCSGNQRSIPRTCMAMSRNAPEMELLPPPTPEPRAQNDAVSESYLERVLLFLAPASTTTTKSA